MYFIFRRIQCAFYKEAVRNQLYGVDASIIACECFASVVAVMAHNRSLHKQSECIHTYVLCFSRWLCVFFSYYNEKKEEGWTKRALLIAHFDELFFCSTWMLFTSTHGTQIRKCTMFVLISIDTCNAQWMQLFKSKELCIRSKIE